MLDRLPLIGRLLADEPAPEPPADAVERRRLEHRRRALQRKLKRMEKALGAGCSTCMKEAPHPQLVRVSKEADRVRAELAHIDARLDAATSN